MLCTGVHCLLGHQATCRAIRYSCGVLPWNSRRSNAAIHSMLMSFILRRGFTMRLPNTFQSPAQSSAVSRIRGALGLEDLIKRRPAMTASYLGVESTAGRQQSENQNQQDAGLCVAEGSLIAHLFAAPASTEAHSLSRQSPIQARTPGMLALTLAEKMRRTEKKEAEEVGHGRQKPTSRRSVHGSEGFS